MPDCPKSTRLYPLDPQAALRVVALHLLWLDLDLSKIAANLGRDDDLTGAIAAAQLDGLRNAAGCLLLAAGQQ